MQGGTNKQAEADTTQCTAEHSNARTIRDGAGRPYQTLGCILAPTGPPPACLCLQLHLGSCGRPLQKPGDHPHHSKLAHCSSIAAAGGKLNPPTHPPTVPHTQACWAGRHKLTAHSSAVATPPGSLLGRGSPRMRSRVSAARSYRRALHQVTGLPRMYASMYTCSRINNVRATLEC